MSPAAVELVKRGLEDPSAVTHFLRKKVIRKTWPIWQSFGFHVVPNHFYYPIPDTDDLRRKQPWNETYPTAGIDLREDRQLELLDECRDYFAEYTHPEREAGFVTNGDGPMLYAMVRKFEPDRIIEVGSGESTAVTLAAARKNEQESGTTTEITAVEPYPDEALRELARGNDGLTVLESRAEDVDVSEYCRLESGDFLFIDSSHTLTVGNDVAHLYLKVLPQLPDGVCVHSHDIRFPAEYPKEWILDEHRFWTEQYLLQAFLMFNETFEVLWAGNHMSDQYPEELERSLPNYRSSAEADDGGGWPGSFWMRRNE
jgi:hypothetical protein